MLVRHTFPLDAEYEFSVAGGGGGGGGPRAAPPSTSPSTARRSTWQNPAAISAAGRRRTARDRRRGRRQAARRRRGRHLLGLPDRCRVRRRRAACSTVDITGPFNPTGLGDTPSRRRIFVCIRARQPSARVAKRPPARARIVTTLARRRLSRARVRRRDRHADGVLSAGPRGRGLRNRHSAGAGARPGRAAVRLPHRRRTRRTLRPARCIASAMSSWRRACRSSCGAAFPTTSCWTGGARAG